MTAAVSADIIATQALQETMATLYTFNNSPYNRSAKYAGTGAAAQFVSHCMWSLSQERSVTGLKQGRVFHLSD
jgi:hypothetical protein